MCGLAGRLWCARVDSSGSGGQQQRIAIARGIIHDPSLIVCDEPTSFLDHQTGTKIMEILRKIVAQKNATLLVVTHDPRIVSFADRIDYLEDGKITQSKEEIRKIEGKIAH